MLSSYRTQMLVERPEAKPTDMIDPINGLTSSEPLRG
jgi:hypothetical protein